MTSFDEAARAHAADPRRRHDFDAAAWSFREKREAAARELDGWEALRDRGAAVRAYALDHLDVLLERFARRAGEAGARVHFAEDAADANARVVEICRERGVARAVKSKSMTTEECGLDRRLEDEGIVVTDTDLGERIVQLFDEPPSHILAPAIHRSREEIAALFHETLGTPEGETDPRRLVAAVRRDLRRRFLEADVGITGANFAVAATGSLVVVENEGNALLSTSLPDVHVAVLGIEKLVAGWDDLSVLLRLLARSATGQPLPVYTTHYTGPQPRGGGEAGRRPRELHIVLLDNGRSRLLADPEHRRALSCIRCGACLNVCPVYRRAGGWAYAWTYPGPIGSVLAPALQEPGGDGRPETLPFASSLCGACTEICPVKIDLHHQLLSWRKRLVEAGRKERSRIRWLAPALRSPRLFRWLTRLARLLRPLAPLVAGPWLGREEGAPRRELPEPAGATFREWWRSRRGRR